MTSSARQASSRILLLLLPLIVTATTSNIHSSNDRKDSSNLITSSDSRFYSTPVLRGGQPTQGETKTLYEQYVGLFHETLDTQNDATFATPLSKDYVPFRSHLEALSTTTFSSTLATSRGDTKAAFYYIEWMMTGPDLGCTLSKEPHLLLQCRNGGRIHVDHTCVVQGVDTAICIHNYPPSFDVDSEFMSVWCSGTEKGELGLTVKVAAGPATCDSGSGEVAHSVSLGQACGKFGSADFKLRVKKSFCNDQTQYQDPEVPEDNPKCKASSEASLDKIELLLPQVDLTAKVSDSSCTYDVNV